MKRQIFVRGRPKVAPAEVQKTPSEEVGTLDLSRGQWPTTIAVDLAAGPDRTGWVNVTSRSAINFGEAIRADGGRGAQTIVDHLRALPPVRRLNGDTPFRATPRPLGEEPRPASTEAERATVEAFQRLQIDTDHNSSFFPFMPRPDGPVSASGAQNTAMDMLREEQFTRQLNSWSDRNIHATVLRVEIRHNPRQIGVIITYLRYDTDTGDHATRSASVEIPIDVLEEQRIPAGRIRQTVVETLHRQRIGHIHIPVHVLGGDSIG